jgi:sulfur relay (sulfurtransferase) DsrF/TusC family protein
LLVRPRPYQRAESRAELDLALAAAALDIPLEVYFLGDAILQLAEGKDPDSALLPAGYRGWAALPELGDARLFAESIWLDRCRAQGLALCLPVSPLAPAELGRRWRGCDRVLVV